jgi:DNA polymerase IV
VEGVVADLAAKACHELRHRRQVARQVGIWISYADGGRAVRQATSPRGTAADVVIRNLAQQALQRAWTRRTRVRSCRLVCDRLHRQSPQLLLFPETAGDEIRQEKTYQAMDRIRNRFGPAFIRTATAPPVH